jgi:cytochrome c oxidase cbb3-type subunit 3
MSKTTRTDDIQGRIVHEYDGIEEADNELPRWWLAIFYLSLLFALGYWFYYHEFNVGLGTAAAYQRDQAELEASRPKGPQGLSDEQIRTWQQDAALVSEGALLFKTNCLACHGEKGEGKIGANLTDVHWIHGGNPVAIHQTIVEGVVAKGMLAWGPILGPDGVQKVTAFVLSIRNSNVPGKPAEGEKYEGM